MKLFPKTINRNRNEYTKMHYRANWQPLWAILGLVLCTLLVVTQGWAAIYDLCAASPGVSKEDSIVDIITAYLGVSSPLPSPVNDPADRKGADIAESQHFSSECMSRTSLYTRQRLDRMSHSRTNGTLTMYRTNQTCATKDGRAKAE